MGKPRKLKAAIKALHDALVSFRPAVGAPMCIQPAKTNSFRDLLTSFHSVYNAPPAAASASFPHSRTRRSHPCYPRNNIPSSEIRPGGKGGMEESEEPAISPSATTAATTSTSGSRLSSSFSAAAAAAREINVEEDRGNNNTGGEAFPSGALCSERFFFPPCSSKSIMDDRPFEQRGSRRPAARSRGNPAFEPLPEAEDECGEGGDDVLDKRLGTATAALRRESTPVAVTSMDPYCDFRSSMEEMVEAQGLRDWPELQELLHSYLGLNDAQTHKHILLAFTDLLMELACKGAVHSSAVRDAFSSSAYRWPSRSHPLAARGGAAPDFRPRRGA